MAADTGAVSSQDHPWFAALADLADDIIVSIDAEGVYRYANAAAARAHGWPTPQCDGRRLSDVFPPHQAAELLANVRRVIASGRPMTSEVELDLHGQRQHHRSNLAPLPNRRGEIDAALVIARDITADRQTAAELNASEERYRLLAEHTGDFLQLSDTNGHTEYLSPSTQRLLGVSASAPDQAQIADRLHPADRPLIDRARAANLAGQSTIIEYRFRGADGHWLWLEGRCSPVLGPDGAVVKLLHVARDITARKTAEEQLQRHEEALRRLTNELVLAEERERRELARNLHDGLGQLLVLVRLKLAAATGLEPGRRAEIAALMGQAEEATRSLTRQLSPPMLYDLGLQPTIEWLAEELGRQYGLRVRLLAERQSAVRLAEPTRVIVFRCLRELLLNVARHAGVAEATVRLEWPPGAVRLTVEDKGVGFDPEILAADPWAEGFGLLSVGERLGQLGGELRLRSAPGAGTVAIITAPCDGPEG
jgi:PAS domain S-box-containing protein